MGSAIADSALLVADAIAAKKADQTAKKAQDLAATNAKLNSQVRDLTLRPKIGGVYSQRESSPTLRQALGVHADPDNSDGSSVPSSFVSPVGGLPPVDTDYKQGAVITATQGAPVRVPLGPDIDEIISGFVINEFGKSKALSQWHDRVGRITTTTLPNRPAVRVTQPGRWVQKKGKAVWQPPKERWETP
jgi:hypothetical protein